LDPFPWRSCQSKFLPTQVFYEEALQRKMFLVVVVVVVVVVIATFE
jgi:hypothetical protein